MLVSLTQKVEQLSSYAVKKSESSVSGLSSRAFMTVQIHLAHSARFSGAGVIAGGPYRCAQSYRWAASVAEDAFIENALYRCMNLLVPQTTQNAQKLA